MSRKKSGEPSPPIDSAPFELSISIQYRHDYATTTTVKALPVGREGKHERLVFDKGLSQLTLLPEIQAFLDTLNLASSRRWTPAEHDGQPDDAVEDFQRLGRRLFGQLFACRDADTSTELQGRLRAWFDSQNLRMVTVDCPVGSFPLDAIYFGVDLNPADRERFIGMRAPIMHQPAQGEDSPESDEDPPTIGFLGHSGLSSVSVADENSIHAVFEQVAGCTVHVMTPLAQPNSKTAMTKADIAALSWALREFRNVWHITSHTRAVGNGRCFTLDNDLTICADELAPGQRAVGRLIGRPLVFLNFCNTGVVSHVDDTHLGAAFGRLGAGGVIATRSLIYERAATRFAELFYRRVFSGMTVATALFDARRDSVLNDETLAALTFFFEAEHDFKLPVAMNTRASDHSEEGERAAAA